MLWRMPYTQTWTWIQKFRGAAQCVTNQTDCSFLDEPLIWLSILCWTWTWKVKAYCSVLEESRHNEMLLCYLLRNWEFLHWNFHVRSVFSVFRKSLGVAMPWITVKSVCISVAVMAKQVQWFSYTVCAEPFSFVFWFLTW